MNQFKTTYNQSIFDICLSIYGDLDHLVNLMNNNPGINLINYIYPGTIILYESNITPIGNFATNNAVYLKPPAIPNIISGPSSIFTFCGEGPAYMSVNASGDDLVYQWQNFTGSSWNNISDQSTPYSIYFAGSITGTNTNELAFNLVPGNWNASLFRCLVSNYEGGSIYTDSAYFDTQNGYITSQPTENVNSAATFSIYTNVTGGVLENIMWEINTTGTADSGFVVIGESANGVSCSGTYSTSTPSTLDLYGGVPFGSGYWFRARVFYNCGIFVSNPAQASYGLV